MGTVVRGRAEKSAGSRFTLFGLVVGLLLAGALPASATGLTDHLRAVRGAQYIAAQQKASGAFPGFSAVGSTADAVIALVAARQGSATVAGAVRYLKEKVAAGRVGTIGLQAKVALALEAAGRNPRAAGGRDLIAGLQDTLGAGGHYGASAVFDDALAVLALEGAGVTPPVSAFAWLATAQCPDGGWQYDAPYAPATDDAHCFTGDAATDYFESDTNTTAYVVMAFAGAGAGDWPSDPFGFFAAIRDTARGGWGYTWGTQTTDANSTALVIQAYAATGATRPGGAMAALRGLQLSCGAWAYTWKGRSPGAPDAGATIGAVPGILGRGLPLQGSGFDTARPAQPRACA